jgi:hypothetical protein
MPEDKFLPCECGYVVVATNEADLVAEIRSHARETHGMELSYEDALVLAFRAELVQRTPAAIAGGKSTTTEAGGA